MSGPATPAPVANDILDRAGDLAIQIVNDMREAAPQVTEAAVRYVWAQGVTGLVLSICMLVLALTLVLAAAMPLFKLAAANKPSSFEYGVGGAVLSIIAFFLMVFAFTAFSSSLPTVLAPEGATVMKLIAAARGE